MCIQIITDKRQQFNGVAYYLCGHYFQHKGKRLHRAVWEHFNGPIPEGYHVHHKDGDTSHNELENLELLPAYEHISEHKNTPEMIEYGRKHIERIRPLASAWHGSPEGAAWHSEHSKQNWAGRTAKKFTCSFCGKEFSSRHAYGETENKFCHPNCNASFHRRIKREMALCM